MIEGVARRWLRDAGLPTDEPTPAAGIVRAVLGPTAIRRSQVQGSYASLARIHDRRVIVLRAQIPHARIPFALAHELGHHIQQAEGLPDTEEGANRIAAALLVPGDALERARGWCTGLVDMAQAFGVSQTLLALREAEYREESRIVRTRSHVFVRGTPGPKLIRTRITDWPGRYVAR